MAYIHKKKAYKYLLAAAFISLIILIIISSTMGVANISFIESLKIMVSKIPFIGRLVNDENIRKSHLLIVSNVRMPRIFLSALVGAGLSIVGSTFQGMFRNPMADPYILGISSGASVGATAAIVLGLEGMVGGLGIIALFAFCLLYTSDAADE